MRFASICFARQGFLKRRFAQSQMISLNSIQWFLLDKILSDVLLTCENDIHFHSGIV